MLYEFQDKLFLEHKRFWFVWEPAWEQFRPIENVVWNGTSFDIQDKTYCADPTHTLYGYGSPQMRELCELLQDKAKDVPFKVTTLPIGQEWFRDRFVAFSPCAPRDVRSWKRMVQHKPRTCRKCPRGKRLTRRNRV